MKVILCGATGMVGQSVLRESVLDADVESVLSIGRKPSGVSHLKVRDVVHADMFDVITSEELGRAMIAVARIGSSKRVLESADLVAVGRRRR